MLIMYMIIYEFYYNVIFHSIKLLFRVMYIFIFMVVTTYDVIKV